MSCLKSANANFFALANVTLVLLSGCSRTQVHPIASPNPEESGNSLDSREPVASSLFLQWCKGSERFSEEKNSTFRTLKSLAGSGVSCADAEAYLTTLEEIDLSGRLLTDVSPLKDMPMLIEINLSENQISDLSPLSQLKNLKTLDVSLQNFSTSEPRFNFVMASLQSSVGLLTSLTSLRFDGNAAVSVDSQGAFIPGSLSGIAKLNNLEGLSLKRLVKIPNSETILLQTIKDLPNIKKVLLGGNDLRPAQCPFANNSVCDFN